MKKLVAAILVSIAALTTGCASILDQPQPVPDFKHGMF